MQDQLIPSQSVTVVFQGGINVANLGTGYDDGSDFLYNVARTQEALPNATIILSTWDTVQLPEAFNTVEKLGIDELVFSADPGGLPNIKFGYDAPNNVNRQIVSTQAGLAKVTTPYALKLRSDSYLVNDNVLQSYGYYITQVQSNSARANQNYSPIAVPTFFTIDPTMYEHMAFHISDWAQFGKLDRLTIYWSAPQMHWDNATYFEVHAHDPDARFADNAFRTRLAVEQHLATAYASEMGYTVPQHYNEITEPILQAHNDFLSSHVIVLDMADFGLSFPKYGWVLTDEFMAMNCISHDDWYQGFYQHWYPNQVDETRLIHANERAQMKRVSALAFDKASTSHQSQVVARLYP